MTNSRIEITDMELNEIIESLLEAIQCDLVKGFTTCAKSKKRLFNKLLPKYKKAFPDSTLTLFCNI